MVIKTYEKNISERKLPINIIDNDLYLFENAKFHEIDEVKVHELNNIYILEKVLFSLKKNTFYDKFCFVNIQTKQKLYSKLFYLFFNKITIENGIWITDDWSKEYFHWFTDALTRFIASESLKSNHKVLISSKFAKNKYITQSLEILNIDYQIYKSKKVIVKNLILPTHTAKTGNFNPIFLNILRSKFIDSSFKANKNIYISRGKAKQRKILNEDEVQSVLEKYSFETHYFEDYDLKEQIKIMQNTKCLLGLHGAGLTNMLFMPTNSRIVELRNANDKDNNCFFSMASDLKHDYFYLECNGDSNDTKDVNITVDIKKLEYILKQVL